MNLRKFKRLFIVSALWGVTIFSGVYFIALNSREKSIKEVKTLVKKQVNKKIEKITFYIPNNDFSALDKVSEDITESESNKEKIVKVVNKNIDILVEKKFLSDRKMNLHNAYISNKILYLDFSFSIGELDAENAKNTLIIQSLVNSVTEIDGIEKVKFIINGNEGKKLLAKYYTHS
ncbi:GerMN domain-containing protein [Fusobacterium sp. PH5-44]|uniref:GerMN domain-containing protein n=1 Tax=unclassified Fusobacterium TaxID=2648384 RepID=UPI003D25FD35